MHCSWSCSFLNWTHPTVEKQTVGVFRNLHEPTAPKEQGLEAAGMGNALM